MKSLKEFLFESVILESNEYFFGNNKFSIYLGDHADERMSRRNIKKKDIINVFIDGYELIKNEISNHKIILSEKKSNDFILVDRRKSKRNCLCIACFVDSKHSIRKISFIIKTFWIGDDFKGMNNSSELKIFID